MGVETFPKGMGPQSHVVNARNMDESEWNMTNNKYHIKANQWWYSVKPIAMNIYFIDDKDNDIVTQYNGAGDDHQSINEEGIDERDQQNTQSLISVQFVALFLCFIGIGAFMCYKRKSKDK